MTRGIDTRGVTLYPDDGLSKRCHGGGSARIVGLMMSLYRGVYLIKGHSKGHRKVTNPIGCDLITMKAK